MSDCTLPDRPLNRPVRLGVLISGGGTTLLNFLEKIEAGALDAEISVVIASRADCRGVSRAREAGLDCEVIDPSEFTDTDAFSQQVFNRLRNAHVDLVTLAGFLCLLQIPDDFSYRVMNIHPSLIPAFCGKGFHGIKVHKAVLERGVKVTGCTVHFADNIYDNGPIILQQSVHVSDDDTADALAERVFAAECETYPAAISLFSSGSLRIRGNRVYTESSP